MKPVVCKFWDASAAAGHLKNKGAAPQRDPNGLNTMNSTAPTPMGQPQLGFIREGHVKFTPAQANMVLKWCRYERQRDETKARSHIATLAEEMRRGSWLEKSQLDFARTGQRLVMVNGHHRMHAQIESGQDILWNIAIHDCASETELRGLYYRFDTNLRKRSAANIMDGVGFAADVGLKKETATALWGAAQVIADGMRFRRYTQNAGHRAILTDERLAICHEYAAEAKFYEGCVKAAPGYMRRRFRTVSMFALAMVTLKNEADTARDFWRGLSEDDGLHKGDPRKTLLLDMQARSGMSGLAVAQLMAGARAWNAYRAGRDLKIIKVTGHPVPIDGTPYVVRA